MRPLVATSVAAVAMLGMAATNAGAWETQRLTDKAFPQAEKTLDDSAPVLSFIRPYAPDLIGFARGFVRGLRVLL